MYITIITADVDRSGISDYGANWTQEPHSPLIHHEHHEEEKTQHSTSTSKKDGGQQFRSRRVSEVIQKDREDCFQTLATPSISTPHFFFLSPGHAKLPNLHTIFRNWKKMLTCQVSQ